MPQKIADKDKESFYDIHKPRRKGILPRPQRMQSKRQVLHGVQFVSVFPRRSAF